MHELNMSSSSKDLPLSMATVIALSLYGLAASVPVSAQTAERTRPSMMEEVIVTAQKREEEISDVPIAMQAFTGDTLKQLGVVDTSDLGNLIPGFSFSNSGKDTPIYTLRGIGFSDTSRTANSAVGVYIDEVPLPYPYMTQGANVDLERIEVLKGPQGTLYGRNTTGGAINYIGKKPTDSLEYGLEAEYGRFETYGMESYISGPFTDRLRGRIALRHLQADEGWQVSLTRPDDRMGEKDKQAARATLEWDTTDSLRFSFTVDWWRDRSDPQAPQPIAIDAQQADLENDQVNPQVRNHPLVKSEEIRPADWVPGFPWRLNNDFIMPALRGYWNIGEDTLVTLIAAYSEFETDEARIPLSGLSVYNTELIEKSTKTDAYSVELRADGRLFDDRLNWLFGLYTSEDEVEDFNQIRFDTNSATFNLQPGVTPVADHTIAIGDQTADINAVFTNQEFAITDYLEVALGARYTEETRKFAGCSVEDPESSSGIGLAAIFNARSLSEGGSGGAGPGDCVTLDEETRNPSLIHKELKEDNLGAKASVTWTPSADHLFYLSVRRGFKSGSFPIVPAAEEEQFEPVTQERLDAIEVGGKTSWFSNALKVNFAVFNYDYKEKQLNSFFIDDIFGPLSKLFNVPESEVRGAELEIQSSPFSGLFISVAASYLETEVIEFVGVTAEGEQNVDFSGNELPFSPDKEITLVANYSFPLPFLSNMEATAGIDYSYVGDAHSALDNNPLGKMVSYELVNARFGIGDFEGHWDVTAWVRNLTNEFYQSNAAGFEADTVTRYTGMPQTAGLTISYRYF